MKDMMLILILFMVSSFSFCFEIFGIKSVVRTSNVKEAGGECD